MASATEVVGTGRATGKVILLGEHAVVFGAPALVVGIDRAVWAEARALPSGVASTLELLDQRWPADAAAEHVVARAFEALRMAGRSPAPSIAARLERELPDGVGLGFSAASGVALGRAIEDLMRRAREGVSDDAVRERAMAWERAFHGNPSGVDVEAALRGGLLRFSRGEGLRTVPWRGALELCVGLSGTRSSTSEMVARVAGLRQRDPEAVDRSMAQIAELVADAEQAIGRGDAALLGELMSRNHEVLVSLRISTDALDRLCRIARAAGALGAKVTGAGGGGAAVAMIGMGENGDAGDRATRVLAAWQAQGFEGFSVAVTPRGNAGASRPGSSS